MNPNFVKTKILATIGPSTDTIDKLEELIDAGVNALRLNFSHGSHTYFKNIFNLINEVCVKKSLPITIVQDLQGPKIRIGELSQPEIELIRDETIEITPEKIKGTKEKISTSYKQLTKDASVGDIILIDDGLIHLEVIKKNNKSISCLIKEGGILKPKKGMNLPGMKLSTPSVTEKDLDDLEFALAHRVDFIALSFVRRSEDIINLKKWLTSKGYDTPIIAKIEKPEACDNFEEILEVSDGIMVARGDLGVEMKPQDVPIIQKRIIKRCNEVGKLVITATQMLESMINNPMPTRAEMTDVANAVWDGTDVVMLSGETSIGKYPVKTVKIMHDILASTEAEISNHSSINYEIPNDLVNNLFDSTGKAVVGMSNQINAAAIVVFTHYGRKAKVISKYRPRTLLIAMSDKFNSLNRLNLSWGIKPYFVENIDNEETAIKEATDILKRFSFINSGDVIMFTAGAPITDKERRSWVRFVVVE